MGFGMNNPITPLGALCCVVSGVIFGNLVFKAYSND